MRNRALHDALRDFALEAAAHLTADAHAGAELAFDVVEEPAGASVLYRYEPLIGQFIGERWDALRRLPACTPAVEALSDGAELYLRVNGGPASADPEPALRAMLERLYRDASGFEFPEERFERVFCELERALYDNTLRTAIVTPLLGLTLEGERVELGDGVFLVAGDRFDAPSEAVWSGGPEPNVLCVLRRDAATDAQLPLTEATRRFTLVLRALRLLKPGGVSLGALAFGRVDEGSWRPLPLPSTGLTRGGGVLLGAGEEAELAELMQLLRGSAASAVAWALARFEMGLDRAHDDEALSDYLLALGALFRADDDAGRASVPLRVAALCAEARERRPLRRRIERAFALEARLKGGAPASDDDPETPRTLVVELEDCLRALLRDVICGYLEPNLRAAADDQLVASGEAVGIAAADLRARPHEPETTEVEALEEPPPMAVEASEQPPPPMAVETSEQPPPAPAAEPEPSPTAPEPAVEPSPPMPPAPAPVQPTLVAELEALDAPHAPAATDGGVTHSSDWEGTNDWEDDAANWSAPV